MITRHCLKNTYSSLDASDFVGNPVWHWLMGQMTGEVDVHPRYCRFDPS